MRKQKGQAILELALVLPIILIIFCAVVDFGRVLQSSSQLNMVAQEAVRIGGLGGTDSEVISYVKNNAAMKDPDKINVTLTPDYTGRHPGDYLTVRITYEVDYITPLMNIFLPSPYTVTAQSTIRIE